MIKCKGNVVCQERQHGGISVGRKAAPSVRMRSGDILHPPPAPPLCASKVFMLCDGESKEGVRYSSHRPTPILACTHRAGVGNFATPSDRYLTRALARSRPVYDLLAHIWVYWPTTGTILNSRFRRLETTIPATKQLHCNCDLQLYRTANGGCQDTA